MLFDLDLPEIDNFFGGVRALVHLLSKAAIQTCQKFSKVIALVHLLNQAT